MSKVITKIRFAHPNLPNTNSNNAGHAYYIATRPGVDKSLSEKEMLDELNASGVSDASYAKYIDERPGSHGLFGPNGNVSLGDTMDELKKYDSYVWRAIVSLKEEDAVPIGYLSKDRWQDMLRSKMFDVAKEMNIRPTNLKWVAAIHMEKGHPHAHVMIWEEKPERMTGVLPKAKLDNIRKIFTDEIFEEDRMRMVLAKNAIRDVLLDDIRGKAVNMSTIVRELKEAGEELKAFSPAMHESSIEPRLYEDVETDLARMIANLSDMMPGDGRIALKFMPEDVKDYALEIADLMLKLPAFEPTVTRGLQNGVELASLYTGKEDALDEVKRNILSDYRKRTAQQILKAAVRWKENDFMRLDVKKADRLTEFFKKTEAVIDVDSEKRSVLDSIASHLKSFGMEQNEIEEILSVKADEFGLNPVGLNLKEMIEKAHVDYLDLSGATKLINREMRIINSLGLSDKRDSLIDGLISSSKSGLVNELDKLVDDKLLKKEGDIYAMTSRGIEAFWKEKRLSDFEQRLFVLLEQGVVGVDELLNDDELVESMFDKASMDRLIDFEPTYFDVSFKEAVGGPSFHVSSVTKYVMDQYASISELGEEAERDLMILNSRLKKLTQHGLLDFDRQTSTYTWTDSAEDAFKNVRGADVTHYDCNVVMKWVEEFGDGENAFSDKGIGDTLKDLNGILEAIEKKAGRTMTKIDENLIKEGSLLRNSNGVLNLTEEGERILKVVGILSRHVPLDKEFNPSELNDRLKKNMKWVMRDLTKLIDSGFFVRSGDNVTFASGSKELFRLLRQARCLDGKVALNAIDVLKEELYANECMRVLKRCEKMVGQGVLENDSKGIRITDHGVEVRRSILDRNYAVLMRNVKSLDVVHGVLDVTQGEGSLKSIYLSEKGKELLHSKEGFDKDSRVFDQKLIRLFESLDGGKLDVDRYSEYLTLLSKGLVHDGKDREKDLHYEDIRKTLGVRDIKAYSIDRFAQMLLAAGNSIEDTRAIITQWLARTEQKLDDEELAVLISKAHSKANEKMAWGKVHIIGKDEWKAAFETIGVKNPPEWMYKARSSIFSLVNNAWKGMWNELNKQERHKEASAERMKKMISRQKGMENKSARKEASRKSKDGLYKDHEFER